ncbi:MAG TPA: dihydrolipoamide acetyltransferase family protein [Myxococcota bacterium]|nr:dihydrolipoamide acetyltransferase family protein [Myxococcota bacterium]
MAISVRVPELGESVASGTIARWLVKEGDRVEVDQPLVEITTDKVDAEIPAPVAGVITALLVAEGETVAVGAEIAQLEEGASAAAGSAAAKPAGAAKPAPPPPTRAAASAPAAAPEGGRASPMAKRAAEDAGVSLGGVSGSGVSGRVMKADVEAAQSARGGAQSARQAAQSPRAAAEPSPSAPAMPAAKTPAKKSAAARAAQEAETRARFSSYAIQEGDRVTPMSPLRKLVAEHMVYSKRTSPHVGTVAEIDMGGVAAVRDAQKRAFEEAHGFGLTFLPFIVHAAVRALREFPALNASVLEDAIVEKRDIHIGIATETDKGLVVPVVRNADRLSLAGLAGAIEDLASRARNRKLTADELKGGTFTISNPGRKGNLYGFAIINQPQVGILRMGEMVKRPVVRSVGGQDAIVIRPMMHLALSYDHRAVDGAPANGFLYRVRELLEEAEFDL